MNARVGSNAFAVLHAGIQKFSRDPAIGIHARDHQRSKEVALAAFIDAKMRLEHFRRMHLFVSKSRFAQNFRFELELHELLHPFALHHDFRPLLVNRDAKLILLRKKNRVRLRRESETEFFQQSAQFFDLIEIERRGKNVHGNFL